MKALFKPNGCDIRPIDADVRPIDADIKELGIITDKETSV